MSTLVPWGKFWWALGFWWTMWSVLRPLFGPVMLPSRLESRWSNSVAVAIVWPLKSGTLQSVTYGASLASTLLFGSSVTCVRGPPRTEIV